MSEFLLVKIFCNHIDSAGISDQDHIVGQLFRTKVKVKYRTVAIDYKF